MAKIPTYEAQLTPQVVETVKPANGLFTSAAEGGTEMMAQMAEISQKFYDLKNVSESSRAATDLSIELAGIEAEATEDVDTSEENLIKYDQKINDAISRHAGTISDGQTRAKALQSFRVSAYNTSTKVASRFRKAQIEVAEYRLLKRVAIVHDTYINTVGEKERKVQRDTVLEEIDAARKVGILTPRQAMSAREDVDSWNKDWQDNQIQAMVNEDPELAKKMILENQYGELTPSERNDWLTIAEKSSAKKQKEHVMAMKIKKEKEEDYFSEKLFNGELTINELKSALEIPESEGGASRTMLNSMKKNLYSAQNKRVQYLVGEFDKADDFDLITSKVLESDIDLMRAREILIDAYGDGVLSGDEAARLNKIIKFSKDIRFAQSTNPFISGWKNIKKVFGDNPKSAKELTEDLKRYLLSATQKDADPIVEASKIVKDRQNKNYPEYQGWQEGKSYETIIGTVKFLGISQNGDALVERLNAN